MYRIEDSIKANIIKLEREGKNWYPWHCKKPFCSDHMCKVRHERLDDIKTLLTALKSYSVVK
jgi:hypothetical protein